VQEQRPNELCLALSVTAPSISVVVPTVFASGALSLFVYGYVCYIKISFDFISFRPHPLCNVSRLSDVQSYSRWSHFIRQVILLLLYITVTL
jgi:hypothetical protein